MSDKCMLTPKNMEELEKISKQGHTIFFFNRDGCPHCHEMKPLEEEGCKVSNGKLNFVDCNVSNNKACRKIAGQIGIEGVPTTIAVPKGGDVSDKSNHAWKVVGSRKDEFKKKLSQTLHSLSDGRQNQDGGARAQQAQQRRTQQPRPTRRGRANIDDQVIQSVSAAERNYPSMNRFEVPKMVDICMPGKECDHDQFEEQVLDFYNTW